MNEKLTRIKQLVESMYNDHIQYPQLRLPEMQERRLNELLELVEGDDDDE